MANFDWIEAEASPALLGEYTETPADLSFDKWLEREKRLEARSVGRKIKNFTGAVFDSAYDFVDKTIPVAYGGESLVEGLLTFEGEAWEALVRSSEVGARDTYNTFKNISANLAQYFNPYLSEDEKNLRKYAVYKNERDYYKAREHFIKSISPKYANKIDFLADVTDASNFVPSLIAVKGGGKAVKATAKKTAGAVGAGATFTAKGFEKVSDLLGTPRRFAQEKNLAGEFGVLQGASAVATMAGVQVPVVSQFAQALTGIGIMEFATKIAGKVGKEVGEVARIFAEPSNHARFLHRLATSDSVSKATRATATRLARLRGTQAYDILFDTFVAGLGAGAMQIAMEGLKGKPAEEIGYAVGQGFGFGAPYGTVFGSRGAGQTLQNYNPDGSMSDRSLASINNYLNKKRQMHDTETIAGFKALDDDSKIALATLDQRANLGNVRISLLSQDQMQSIINANVADAPQTKAGRTPPAMYSSTDGVIYINQDQIKEGTKVANEVFLHELGHHAQRELMGNSPMQKRQILEAFKDTNGVDFVYRNEDGRQVGTVKVNKDAVKFARDYARAIFVTSPAQSVELGFGEIVGEGDNAYYQFTEEYQGNGNADFLAEEIGAEAFGLAYSDSPNAFANMNKGLRHQLFNSMQTALAKLGVIDPAGNASESRISKSLLRYDGVKKVYDNFMGMKEQHLRDRANDIDRGRKHTPDKGQKSDERFTQLFGGIGVNLGIASQFHVQDSQMFDELQKAIEMQGGQEGDFTGVGKGNEGRNLHWKVKQVFGMAGKYNNAVSSIIDMIQSAIDNRKMLKFGYRSASLFRRSDYNPFFERSVTPYAWQISPKKPYFSKRYAKMVYPNLKVMGYDADIVENNIELMAQAGLLNAYASDGISSVEGFKQAFAKHAKSVLTDSGRESRINPLGRGENELFTMAFGMKESGDKIQDPRLNEWFSNPENKLKQALKSYDVSALAGLATENKDGFAYDYHNVKFNYMPNLSGNMHNHSPSNRAEQGAHEARTANKYFRGGKHVTFNEFIALPKEASQLSEQEMLDIIRDPQSDPVIGGEKLSQHLVNFALSPDESFAGDVDRMGAFYLGITKDNPDIFTYPKNDDIATYDIIPDLDDWDDDWTKKFIDAHFKRYLGEEWDVRVEQNYGDYELTFRQNGKYITTVEVEGGQGMYSYDPSPEKEDTRKIIMLDTMGIGREGEQRDDQLSGKAFYQAIYDLADMSNATLLHPSLTDINIMRNVSVRFSQFLKSRKHAHIAVEFKEIPQGYGNQKLGELPSVDLYTPTDKESIRVGEPLPKEKRRGQTYDSSQHVRLASAFALKEHSQVAQEYFLDPTQEDTNYKPPANTPLAQRWEELASYNEGGFTLLDFFEYDFDENRIYMYDYLSGKKYPVEPKSNATREELRNFYGRTQRTKDKIKQLEDAGDDFTAIKESLGNVAPEVLLSGKNIEAFLREVNLYKLTTTPQNGLTGILQGTLSFPRGIGMTTFRRAVMTNTLNHQTKLKQPSIESDQKFVKHDVQKRLMFTPAEMIPDHDPHLVRKARLRRNPKSFINAEEGSIVTPDGDVYDIGHDRTNILSSRTPESAYNKLNQIAFENSDNPIFGDYVSKVADILIEMHEGLIDANYAKTNPSIFKDEMSGATATPSNVGFPSAQTQSYTDYVRGQRVIRHYGWNKNLFSNKQQERQVKLAFAYLHLINNLILDGWTLITPIDEFVQIQTNYKNKDDKAFKEKLKDAYRFGELIGAEPSLEVLYGGEFLESYLSKFTLPIDDVINPEKNKRLVKKHSYASELDMKNYQKTIDTPQSRVSMEADGHEFDFSQLRTLGFTPDTSHISPYDPHKEVLNESDIDEILNNDLKVHEKIRTGDDYFDFDEHGNKYDFSTFPLTSKMLETELEPLLSDMIGLMKKDVDGLVRNGRKAESGNVVKLDSDKHLQRYLNVLQHLTKRSRAGREARFINNRSPKNPFPIEGVAGRHQRQHTRQRLTEDGKIVSESYDRKTSRIMVDMNEDSAFTNERFSEWFRTFIHETWHALSQPLLDLSYNKKYGLDLSHLGIEEEAKAHYYVPRQKRGEIVTGFNNLQAMRTFVYEQVASEMASSTNLNDLDYLDSLMYGLSSNAEFVTESMSNYNMMNYLSAIKIDDDMKKILSGRYGYKFEEGYKPTTLFQILADIILQMIGIDKKVYDGSAMQEVLKDIQRISDQDTGVFPPLQLQDVSPVPRDLRFMPYTMLTDETAQHFDDLIEDMKRNPWGFTIDQSNLVHAERGYVVAPEKETEFIIPMSEMNRTELWNYIKNHAHRFREEGAHLGGWISNERGFMLDVSFPIDNYIDAVRMAVWGDQDSIFDIETETEIETKINNEIIIPEGFPLTKEEIQKQAPNNALAFAVEAFRKSRRVRHTSLESDIASLQEQGLEGLPMQDSLRFMPSELTFSKSEDTDMAFPMLSVSHKGLDKPTVYKDETEDGSFREKILADAGNRLTKDSKSWTDSDWRDFFKAGDTADALLKTMADSATPYAWDLVHQVRFQNIESFDIPAPPTKLLEYVRNPKLVVDMLDKTSMTNPEFIELAKSGYLSAKEMHDIEKTPEMVSQAFIWGLLSRMLDPYNQEAGWLRVTNNRPMWSAIFDSIDGNYNMPRGTFYTMEDIAMEQKESYWSSLSALKNIDSDIKTSEKELKEFDVPDLKPLVEGAENYKKQQDKITDLEAVLKEAPASDKNRIRKQISSAKVALRNIKKRNTQKEKKKIKNKLNALKNKLKSAKKKRDKFFDDKIKALSKEDKIKYLELAHDKNLNQQKGTFVDIVSNMFEDQKNEVSAGNNAKQNIQAIHDMLVKWNGKWKELTKIFNNKKLDGQQIREEMWSNGFLGAGVKDKVTSFVIALMADPNVVIMDRWQFVNCWENEIQGAVQQRLNEVNKIIADPSASKKDKDLADRQKKEYVKYGVSPYRVDEKGVPEDRSGFYKTIGSKLDDPVEHGIYRTLEFYFDKIAQEVSKKKKYDWIDSAFALHWVTWNIIKKEAVGHSSFDVIGEMASAGQFPTTPSQRTQFVEDFISRPKFTEKNERLPKENKTRRTRFLQDSEGKPIEEVKETDETGAESIYFRGL